MTAQRLLVSPHVEKDGCKLLSCLQPEEELKIRDRGAGGAGKGGEGEGASALPIILEKKIFTLKLTVLLLP